MDNIQSNSGSASSAQNMSPIHSTVIKLLSKTLKIDEAKISEESNFAEDLGADSLDLVEMVMALEAQFGIEIPDEDASKIATVADAIRYVETKKAVSN